jgi:imidazoleglycerol-phosphate dehydratase
MRAEFFQGFARNARCALHILQMAGSNSHHIIEGAFKSVGRSLRAATAMDPGFEGEIPSTKGVL